MNKKILIVTSIFVLGILFYYFIETEQSFRSDVRDTLIDTGLKQDFERPYSTLDDHPIAYYAINEEISEITSINQETYELLPQTLIIPSGNYMIYDNIYQLDEEGLYRFILPGVENSQRIVYNGNDVEKLLSAISWIYTHGNSDSGKSIELLNQKAMNSKIFGICTTISKWLIQTLEEQNVSSRLVQTMTLDDWNTYNNGHTMIEVYRDDLQKWVLYDLDNNAFFTENGNYLSLIEFTDNIKNKNNYKIHYLSSDAKIDISNFKSKNSYDYSFFAESIYSNEDSLRNWYSRIAQVSLIQNENLDFNFSDEENKIKIENFAPNYKFIERDYFMTKFYE